MASEETTQASAPQVVEPAWQPVSETDLAAAEAHLAKASRGAAFGFVPADAHWLANITAHMIREVRATRASAPQVVEPAHADLIERLKKKYGHPFEVLKGGIVEERHHDFTRHPLVHEAIAALAQASAPSVLVPLTDEQRAGLVVEAIRPMLQEAVGTGHWGNGWPGYWPLARAAVAALASALPAAQQPAVEPVDRTFALMLLSEASKSGHLGTMKLAAQLAGVPACEGCGYVVQHCRCASPTAQPAAPDVVADARRWREHIAAQGEHSHQCIRCAFQYTPPADESEDCPKCGHDGSAIDAELPAEGQKP